jgi:hypothetical protein
MYIVIQCYMSLPASLHWHQPCTLSSNVTCHYLHHCIGISHVHCYPMYVTCHYLHHCIGISHVHCHPMLHVITCIIALASAMYIVIQCYMSLPASLHWHQPCTLSSNVTCHYLHHHIGISHLHCHLMLHVITCIMSLLASCHYIMSLHHVISCIMSLLASCHYLHHVTCHYIWVASAFSTLSSEAGVKSKKMSKFWKCDVTKRKWGAGKRLIQDSVSIGAPLMEFWVISTFSTLSSDAGVKS